MGSKEAAEKAEKEHTRFVVGGIYRFDAGVDTYTGLMFGSVEKSTGNGRRKGQIYVPGMTPFQLIEDGEDLDKWTLISEPASSELLDRFVALSGACDYLAEKVSQLENNLGIPSAPQKTDDILAALNARKKEKV